MSAKGGSSDMCSRKAAASRRQLEWTKAANEICCWKCRCNEAAVPTVDTHKGSRQMKKLKALTKSCPEI
eukprot:scaffold61156_cov20-Cyclotella_meneghiniana.AAC.1